MKDKTATNVMFFWDVASCLSKVFFNFKCMGLLLKLYFPVWFIASPQSKTIQLIVLKDVFF